MTFLSVAVMAVMAVMPRGRVQRLLILLGLGNPVNVSVISNAACFGLPAFTAPVFTIHTMLLIAVAGARIWADNKVDFSDNRNLLLAAVTLVLGTGDFTLKFGQCALGGMGTATLGATLLYALLNRRPAEFNRRFPT